MKKNVGSLDRMIRIAVAVILAALVWAEVLTGTAAVVGVVVAAIFLLTGLLRFCPLFLPFKISTQKQTGTQ
jgi:riboflavin transporter FmnP